MAATRLSLPAAHGGRMATRRDPTKTCARCRRKSTMPINWSPTPLRADNADKRQSRSQGRVRLRAKVVDKAGCKVRKRIRWSTKGGRINRKGFFRPTKTRLGRTATVIARSGKLRLRFNVEVTNEANLAKWMPARPSIAPQTKIAVPETSEIMGIKVTARHPASKQADSFVNRLDRGPLILAILGFLLLSAGLILVRRKTIN